MKKANTYSITNLEYIREDVDASIEALYSAIEFFGRIKNEIFSESFGIGIQLLGEE